MSTEEERQIWRAQFADKDGSLFQVRCLSTYENIEADLHEIEKRLSTTDRKDYRVVRWWTH